MEFKKRLWVPAGSGYRLIKHSGKRRAFGKTKDPNQVHGHIDGYDDEDEEVLHPCVGGDSVQGDSEGRFASRRCDDAEGSSDDGVEVDRLEVFVTDGCLMPTKPKRNQIRIYGDRDH